MRQGVLISYGGNLGRDGQNTRLRMGVVFLSLALIGSVLLVRGPVDRAYRLLMFFPFFMAAFCACQGLFRVCPMHTKNKSRELDGGEVIPHEGTHGRCIIASRKLTVSVLSTSVGLSVLATVLVYVLPVAS